MSQRRVWYVDDPHDGRDATLAAVLDDEQAVTAVAPEAVTDSIDPATTGCVVAGPGTAVGDVAPGTDLPVLALVDPGADVQAALDAGATDVVPLVDDWPALLAHRVRDGLAAEAVPERYRRYERIVETVADPMYVLDESGTIEMVNDAFVERYGYDRETLLGQPITEFVGDTDRVLAEADDLVRDVLSEDTDTTSGTLVFPGERADGTHGYAEANQSVRLDDDGRYRGVVGVLRDVTERVERADSLRQYRELVQTVADPMYRLDADGRFQMVNEAMVDLMGYEREELLGDHISAYVGEDAVAAGREVVRELLDDPDRSTGRYEFTVETAAGETRHAENNLTLLTDDDGEFVGSVGAVRDVHDRKRREREFAKYERIIDTAPVGLFALDETDTIIWANESFAGYMDRTVDDLVGADFESFIDRGVYAPEVPEKYAANVRRLLSASCDVERENYETTVALPGSGETAVFDTHLSLLPRDPDGEFRGTVVAYRDITKQRGYERQLERQNERLDRFASVVSHDLRNPLTVAKGNLELVREHDDADAVDAIETALSRIEALVDDLLQLARHGHAVASTEPVSLASVATDAWATVDTGAATLATAADGTVAADRGRLRQLFENCFRNAVEHGPPHTRTQTEGEDADEPPGADLTVRVGDLPDGFYVADDGVGIPASEREDVFELGFTTASDGTGFGLGIVADIVDVHDWTVAATESEDGGARFEVRGVDRPASATDDASQG